MFGLHEPAERSLSCTVGAKRNLLDKQQLNNHNAVSNNVQEIHPWDAAFNQSMRKARAWRVQGQTSSIQYAARQWQVACYCASSP